MSNIIQQRKKAIANEKAKHLLDYFKTTENIYSYNKLKEIINLYNDK